MNNKNVIARVKLNVGQIGYFDDLTQIYLTRQNPYADVIAGMNCTTLVNAVKAGKICVVEGTIRQNSRVKKIFKLPQTVISAPIEVQQNKAAEEVIETPAKKEEPVVEEVVSTPVAEEAPVIEESPATEEVEAPVVEELIKEEVKPTLVLPATEVTLSKKGETFSLTTSVDNAAYSTSDPTVALVARKSGKVTAKAEGTAVITVTADGYEDATCTVTVKYEEEAAE